MQTAETYEDRLRRQRDRIDYDVRAVLVRHAAVVSAAILGKDSQATVDDVVTHDEHDDYRWSVAVGDVDLEVVLVEERVEEGEGDGVALSLRGHHRRHLFLDEFFCGASGPYAPLTDRAVDALIYDLQGFDLDIVVARAKAMATFSPPPPPPGKSEKIERILCSSGEVDLDVRVGQTLRDVLNAAGSALDSAYCNNVVVICADGKYLVGEFQFRFREVPEDEARRVAEEFGGERCSDLECHGECRTHGDEEEE